MQLTKEIEENGIMPFLDCLVTRDNNRLRTTIYRKPTHTDRLLDQSSFNPTSHKATTIRTRRAQLVCDSPDSLRDETDYLNNVFSKKTKMLDGTLTITLILTLRPTSTLALLPYDCDYTVPYTFYTVHCCLLLLFYKINAATARLLTSVKSAENLARDWPNTNERREMVTSTITLLSTI